MNALRLTLLRMYPQGQYYIPIHLPPYHRSRLRLTSFSYRREQNSEQANVVQTYGHPVPEAVTKLHSLSVRTTSTNTRLTFYAVIADAPTIVWHVTGRGVG